MSLENKLKTNIAKAFAEGLEQKAQEEKLKQGLCSASIRDDKNYQYCERAFCRFDQMQYPHDYEVYNGGLRCMKIIYDERVLRELRRGRK